jgi:hypothetical protein
MLQRIYCTVSNVNEAEALVARIQETGFKPQTVLTAGSANEIEGVLHPPSEFIYSAKIGILWGTLIGALIGLMQAAYIGPAAYESASRLFVVMAWSAFGWAIYGGIVGGSGVLSPGRMSPQSEREFEEQVTHSRILVCAQSPAVADEVAVKRALAEAGAANIYCRITPAA